LLELKQILGLTIWELEQLIVWYHASKSRNEAVSVKLLSNDKVTPSVNGLNVTYLNSAHTVDMKGYGHKKGARRYHQPLFSGSLQKMDSK